jgi:hypothetical protein
MTGEWNFLHSNKLEVRYPDAGKSFELTFDYLQNKMTIEATSSSIAGFPYTTTFDNAAEAWQT